MIPILFLLLLLKYVFDEEFLSQIYFNCYPLVNPLRREATKSRAHRDEVIVEYEFAV